MAEGITVGGRTYPLEVSLGEVPVPVLDWRDTGLELLATGHNAIATGNEQIDTVTVHWTGGEGELAQLLSTLQTRGYGVEFFVSRLGVVQQLCDPLVIDAAGAGGVNARTVNIEVACYGFAGWDPRRRVFRVPPVARDRECYADRLHGVEKIHAKPYPWQMTALKQLVRTLCTVLNVPRRVPEVTNRALTAAEQHAFSGVWGHYHVTDRKRDPGSWVMQQIDDDFVSAGSVRWS